MGILSVTLSPGDEALASEYETTRDSWKGIKNLLLQLPSAMKTTKWPYFIETSPRSISQSLKSFLAFISTHNCHDHARSRHFNKHQNVVEANPKNIIETGKPHVEKPNIINCNLAVCIQNEPGELRVL
jgi:hypothetical protein